MTNQPYLMSRAVFIAQTPPESDKVKVVELGRSCMPFVSSLYCSFAAMDNQLRELRVDHPSCQEVLHIFRSTCKACFDKDWLTECQKVRPVRCIRAEALGHVHGVVFTLVWDNNVWAMQLFMVQIKEPDQQTAMNLRFNSHKE